MVMGKHTDKLGTYEDFTAPWETESGADAEIEKPKLKRLIFNLKLGEAKALDAQEEAREKITAAEQERDAAKADAEKASPEEANKKIAKLEAENADLKKEKADREAADALEAVRKEVLGDFAEKHPNAAKYVVGADKKSLEESLEAVKEDFGIKDGASDDDEDDAERALRSKPRARLNSGTDPAANKGPENYDFDKIADDIIGNGPFG
jgi:hypothetical protein